MFLTMGILIAIAAVGSILFGFAQEVSWAKIIGCIFIVIAAVLIISHFNTAQGSRDLKNFTSNTTGGLERKVEVYDQSGKLLKTYEGKLDIQDTDYGNKVLFDLNGKRTIIYNATVIVQEK
jgi:hypothetical protein